MQTEPNRDEGKSSALWLSPGLVDSGETLLRTIFDPNHFENGKLAARAAISLDDIKFRGWSADRRCFTSLWVVRLAHVKRKLRNKRIKAQYVLPFRVADIRLLDSSTKTQDFVVTDTAGFLSPAHASVLLARSCGDGTARGLRVKLFSRLSNYVSVKEAFGSGQSYGYAKGLSRQLKSILTTPFRIFSRS